MKEFNDKCKIPFLIKQPIFKTDTYDVKKHILITQEYEYYMNIQKFDFKLTHQIINGLVDNCQNIEIIDTGNTVPLPDGPTIANRSLMILDENIDENIIISKDIYDNIRLYISFNNMKLSSSSIIGNNFDIFNAKINIFGIDKELVVVRTLTNTILLTDNINYDYIMRETDDYATPRCGNSIILKCFRLKSITSCEYSKVIHLTGNKALLGKYNSKKRRATLNKVLN